MTAAYNKNIGYMLTLGMDPTNSTSYTALGHIVDIKGGNVVKTDFGDTTLLGDKYKTFLPASIDPGTFSFSIGWDAADAVSGGTYYLLTQQQYSQAIASFQLTCTFPDTTTKTEVFHGYIESVGRVYEKTKLSTVDVVVRLSGDPGLGHA